MVKENLIHHPKHEFENMRKKIRVLLAEGHHMVCTPFAALLSEEPDIEVVGVVPDTTGLLDTVARLKPDVLILGTHRPGGKVITTTKMLRREQPGICVLVLSGHERNEYVARLVGAGVTGYVLKRDSSDMLVEAVRAVAEGEEWFSPRIGGILMMAMRDHNGSPSPKLTPREAEVLALMSKGHKNDEIARNLAVKPPTIKNHVRRIFHKLGVETKGDAILYALEHELERP